MSQANNVLPAWLVLDLCRHCFAKLEITRKEKPGQMEKCPKCP